MQRAVRRVSPYRNRSTLQSWLDEFSALEYAAASSIRVVDQDGESGSDTGLVRVALANTETDAYIQPVRIGAPQWVVTIVAREQDLELTAPELVDLAAELTMMSALCAFLEAKSTATPADQT